MGTANGSTRNVLFGVIKAQLGLTEISTDWIRIIITGQSADRHPLSHEDTRQALSFIGDSIVELALRRWYNSHGHAQGFEPTWVDHATTNERMAMYLEHIGVAHNARLLTGSRRNARKAAHTLGTTFECALAIIDRCLGTAAAEAYVIERYLPFVLSQPLPTITATNRPTAMSADVHHPEDAPVVATTARNGRPLHPWAELVIFARQHGHPVPLVQNRRRGGPRNAVYHCTAKLNGCLTRGKSPNPSRARESALTRLLAEIRKQPA